MSKLDLITDPTTRALAGALASSGVHASQTIDRIIVHFTARIDALEQSLAQWQTEARTPTAPPAGTPTIGLKRSAADPSVTGDGAPNHARAEKAARRAPPANNDACLHESAHSTIRGLSFTTPRKKLDLELATSGARLRRADGTVELSVAYTRLRCMLCLPTPGRVKPHWTVVWLLQPTGTGDPVDSSDVVAFGVTETDGLKLESAAGNGSSEILTRALLLQELQRHSGVTVTEPSPSTFSVKKRGSTATAANASPRLHIDCHLKARDGHLYFLADSLFFGFRKPIVHLPLARIACINVMSITSRTFDLRMTLHPVGLDASCTATSVNGTTSTDKPTTATADKQRHFDFTMIDAADFEAVAQYVRAAKIDAPELSGQAKEKTDTSASGASGQRSSNPTTTISDIPLESSDDEEDEDYRGGGHDDSDGDNSDSDSASDQSMAAEEDDDDDEE